jgi:hypothetical protein
MKRVAAGTRKLIDPGLRPHDPAEGFVSLSEKSTAGNTEWYVDFQLAPATQNLPKISLALPISIRHAAKAGQFCHHCWIKQ